jgi:hypothetical protein
LQRSPSAWRGRCCTERGCDMWLMSDLEAVMCVAAVAVLMTLALL